ncbi:MAG: hypothetical protein KME30_00075 [Iphinoe sp. HA4291-MV1]|jgi:hypothetical protein|nr:hypothetical protein [Iphinoe sp. HA4291-MV1]
MSPKSLAISSSSLTPANRIISKLQELSSQQQQKVLDFIESLILESNPQKSIWQEIQDIVEQVPEELWDELPTDGAENHDHYLYGAPKVKA